MFGSLQIIYLKWIPQERRDNLRSTQFKGLPKMLVNIVQELPCAVNLTRLDGSGIVYQGSYYSCHIKGRKTEYHILDSHESESINSRKIVSEVTSLDFNDVKPTYSGMARQLSVWISNRESNNKINADIIPVWHYQKCSPAQMPNMKVCDMTAAYFQMACRAKSLFCEMVDGRVIWHAVDSRTEQRWEIIKLKIKPYKKLRLALIGVNSTSLNTNSRSSTKKYYRGKLCRMSGQPPTQFRNLAALTVRASYELTQIQSIECDSIYSNADCITTEINRKLKYWDDAGIEYSIRAQGDLDLKACGVWKCGERETLNYKNFGGFASHSPKNIETRYIEQLLG